MHQINAAALGIMISRHSVHQGLSLPSNWLTVRKSYRFTNVKFPPKFDSKK